MGKPTWVEGGGRRGSTTFLGMDSPEPKEPQFPRRLPRTGTAFQCKGIPKVQEKYQSSRSSAPVLMSADVPHRTVVEIEASEKGSACTFDYANEFNFSLTDGTALVETKGKRNEQVVLYSCVVMKRMWGDMSTKTRLFQTME